MNAAAWSASTRGGGGTRGLRPHRARCVRDAAAHVRIASVTHPDATTATLTDSIPLCALRTDVTLPHDPLATRAPLPSRPRVAGIRRPRAAGCARSGFAPRCGAPNPRGRGCPPAPRRENTGVEPSWGCAHRDNPWGRLGSCASPLRVASQPSGIIQFVRPRLPRPRCGCCPPPPGQTRRRLAAPRSPAPFARRPLRATPRRRVCPRTARGFLRWSR